MAIQDENAKNGGASNTAMGAAFQRAGAAPAAAAASTDAGSAGGGVTGGAPRGAGAASPRPNMFSWRNMGSLVQTPMGRNPASEQLTKLHKAIAAVYENANPLFEMDLIPIDMNQTAALTVSVLVVCARLKANPSAGVAFHTLILEGSTEPPAPRYVPINGQNVEVLVTMGEANNDKLREVVLDHVMRQYPQQRTWLADACVVPREFDLANETAVYSLAANAAYACSVELDTKRADFVDMNLANASNDALLTVRTAFPKNQVINAVNQPVRQDLTIDLQATPASSNQNQQLMERTATIARISGFLDLVWAPVNPISSPYNPFPQAQQPGLPITNQFQRYIARLVMTGMESVAAPTLSCQLLTLAMAAALQENNMWVQAFRPTPYAQGMTDMHDIGAVGIEANFEGNPNGIGSRVNTKDDSFRSTDLGRLVAATIRQGLIFSLDVEECGPSTWINGIFAAAATGHAGANRAIIEAADTLTNGAFSRHYPTNQRVAINEDNRIHLGYYYDGDVKRDIRDIDYLAVLNLIAEKDPEVIRDWSDTFQQIQYPLEQRLAARKRIISGLVPTATFTGFAQRVTFEAAFIDALIKGCQECGLDVKSVAPYTDIGSYERATASFAGQALFQTQNTGLFNRGGMYQGQSTVAGARTFTSGRWF